ncbi:long-chain fatty acid transporter [Hoeflea sp. BAL378]|nr:long-chain fatty acid transporter [Hoeflea sp. BAL378]
MRAVLKTIVAGLSVSVAFASAAQAGGLERGGYNIDLLFDTSRFASDASVAYVMPDRELTNVVDTNARDGIGSNGFGAGTRTADETESYLVPRIGFKVGLGESADCMADYSQPYGAHTNPGANWMGANSNIETKIESDGLAATCSYKFKAGKGDLRVIGGVSYLDMSGFKTRLVAPPALALGNGQGRLDLSGDGYGYRIGAAYEIPEIAFRASLMYYSEVDLDDITGTLNLSQVNGQVIPVFGSTSMPEAVEFKVQSGIAPGWLAFGSVKWVDWSQLQTVAFCPTATRALGCSYSGVNRATSLDLLYRDGWTVSGGVGHRFNDNLSGLASLTWDRGTSTGTGTQTDTWTAAAGIAYTPNQNVEVRLGGALGVLTSGSSGVVTTSQGRFGTDVSYNFGNDLVAAVSGAIKVKF